MMMTRFYRLSLIVALLVLLTSCAVAPKVDPAKINKAARINTELGVMYLRKGQHELSMQKLSKAIEQDVDYAPAHESIAILYEELGEIGKADKHYRRALAIEDDSSSTLNNYGQFLCRQNKLERADKYFQRAFKDPLFAHPELIYTNAGICASQQPDVQKAETYFRQALQVMPEYLPALKQMALLTFSQDNYLGSRAYLQRYGSRAPLTADLLWIALRVEHRLNDTIAEKKYATDLKRRYPQSKEAGFLKNGKMNKVSDIDTISPAPEADNGLKDVGATLRTVREEQGLRVEEVSERLRLSPDVLLAIEAGDSEHLPATTFLRGYIRSYAKLLRLDENEILSHVADTLEKPRIHLTRNTPFKPQRRLPGKRWLLWGGIGLGVAALLLVAVPLIERLLSKQTATEEAVPTLILPKRESRPAPITPATPVLPTPASPAANAASAAAKLPEKTASVVSRELSLSFAQDTWLEVTYAQKKQVAGIMKAGTRKTFNAAPPIEILLGNAPAVTIEYDGKPFNHQRYIKGKVARFTLK